MWMSQSGGCKISAAKKQSGRHSKKARWKATRRPSQLPSAVWSAPNSGRHGSRPSTRNKSGAGAPRSKNFSSNPSQQRRRGSVGRAVHCGPWLVMQTQLPGLNLGFPRPYERGYEPVICWCGKNTLLILHPAGRGLPARPEIEFWQGKNLKERSGCDVPGYVGSVPNEPIHT